MTETLLLTGVTEKPAFSFAHLPHEAGTHFKLYFYAAVLHVLSRLALPAADEATDRATDGEADENGCRAEDVVFGQYPFLLGYNDELAGFGLAGMGIEDAKNAWRLALEAWEVDSPAPLPISDLKSATGLSYDALTLLAAIGLIEEDARFGPLFAAMQATPGQVRPTLSLLSAWWCGEDGYGEVRADLRRLQELGLVEVINPSATRLEWAYQPSALLWDALRGERVERPAAWCRYLPPEQCSDLDGLILPADIRTFVETLPFLLQNAEVKTVVVRGAQHNGRRTLLGALARRLGRGVILVDGSKPGEDERLKPIAPLAALTRSIPIIHYELAPGESAFIPSMDGFGGFLGVVMGSLGGLTGPGAERVLTLALDVPGVAVRRELWLRQVGSVPEINEIAARLRLPTGNIARVAAMARPYAALAGRVKVSLADVQSASRALNRQSLETLAQRLDALGGWSTIAVADETRRELLGLENRIRHRERLADGVGAALRGQVNCGVRALFSGASGTGKTLAVRVLASVLQMDVYRLDLASVVNKYIGETEKNLNQVFSRAEELDVILLLDEGDALMTQRTSVNTSNDRYANLETNFLLQRMESFRGVLIVTTNAGDRIDQAFQRRMDVVIDFHLPDVVERMEIWQSHLPVEHALEYDLLEEMASRCALNGAQIRNAVIHASLLALNEPDNRINADCLTRALKREYRKMGAVYPLG